ncbi:ATP-binding protein [Natrialba swarupiae]|uniref:histidine kinase n=1 Tax=Natrialba swarupiae TaxID=2448032 RepID=A0A5D5AL92_9EURY|nr:ATP-binding protein [Natrialba swarupiae]TYT62529.1 PAS domain S-box protein [Natrialba swarupiae]
MPEHPIRVLVIGADHSSLCLGDGFDVRLEPTAETGRAVLADESTRIDCVVTHHGRVDCLEALEMLREGNPDVPCIVTLEPADRSIAADAIERGATDYYIANGSSSLLATRIRTAVGHPPRRTLERRNRRLETLVDNLPGIVYRCRNEPGWPMERIEGECEQITGYPAGAFERGDVSLGDDVVHPEDRERTWETVQDTLDAREPYEVTYRITTADGSTRWVWERGRGIYDDGDLAALEGFIADITERTEGERKRRRNQRRFEAVFDDPKTIVALLDLDGTLLQANQAAMAYVDEDRSAVVGEPFWETSWWTENVADKVEQWVERAAAGEYVGYETNLDPTNGENERISGTIRPVTNEDGEPTSLIASARNITDQRDRNRRLEQTRDQLAVLNQVVRHDLRNHMQVVRGQGRLLADHVDGDADQHLEAVLLAAEEAIDLTTTARELTATMSEDETELKRVLVHQTVTSVVESARSRYAGAEITVYGLGSDVAIEANEMFESVLHNLVQNAIIHNDSDRPKVEVSIDRRNDSVLVSVADDGPGISDRQKREVFGRGKKGLESPGTGVGLYLVRTLVEGYGGDVWIEDNEPRGSVFVVRLPIDEESVTSHSTERVD